LPEKSLQDLSPETINEQPVIAQDIEQQQQSLILKDTGNPDKGKHVVSIISQNK
jgi:hypothetical protein